MSEKKTYTGSCHCGKVRFEIQADLAQAIECNCSICAKAGYVLAFVPEADFTLLSGAEELSDYQFNKKRIHHTFCRSCGIHPFSNTSGIGDRGPMRAVNLRCVDELDLSALDTKHFDGKSL